ncbi:MAG: MFS transporter [Nitrososphaerota archaeon]|nr:MFS transporter [Nitrososphaerota archaeon]
MADLKVASKGSSEKPRSRKISWFYSALPYNIGAGPISTYVQLAILAIYGQSLGTIYVGLVVTLFNGVTIPAAMIWGFATDRFHQRRPIIVASFFLVAGNLIALLFAHSIYVIAVLYGAFSLLSSASATPYNLLIMETEPKPKWATAFANFSMISSIGTTIGLLLGIFWADVLPFEWMLIPLAAFSLLSAVLSIVMIKEPSFVFEREMMVLQKRSFYQRLLAIPMIFLRVPRVSDFRRVFKGMRNELTGHIPILYLSIVMFYLGGGIFNTSLVPSMYAQRFTEGEVFLVLLVAMVVQIISFRYIGPYLEKRSLVQTAVSGLALRSCSYAAIGASVLFLPGLVFMAPMLIFYPIGAGLAYATYYTASNTMVFNSLGPRSQGSSLGVYSAMVGTSTMVGSLISGFTSFYQGYDTTFVLAALCLVGSAFLTYSLTHFKQYQVSGKVLA